MNYRELYCCVEIDAVGLISTQHIGGMGLYSGPKSELGLSSNASPHTSLPSTPSTAAGADFQQQQQVKTQSHLPFDQSPSDAHYAQQQQPPPVVSRPSQLQLTPPASQTHMPTYNQPPAPSGPDIPLSGGLMTLSDQLEAGQAPQTFISTLPEKPKKKRRRRKKADAAASDDIEPGCTGSDLDLNPLHFISHLPRELALGLCHLCSDSSFSFKSLGLRFPLTRMHFVRKLSV